MATSSYLENSSFTDLVVPFDTTNGLGDKSTGNIPLTGFTMDITKFTFTPILSALESTNIGVSLDKLIWDMGDGTFETGFSVSKQYKYPGEYRVSTILTDQNGVTHKRNRHRGWRWPQETQGAPLYLTGVEHSNRPSLLRLEYGSLT